MFRCNERINPEWREMKRAGACAFTLIELLVAVAVLALVSLVLMQLLSAASQTWIIGQAKVNNFTKGRSMLDLLARDLQQGIYRDDLPVFPNGLTAFYTQRPGFSGSAGPIRNVSWTQYDLGAATNTVLQRAELALNWNTSQSLAFGSTIAPSGAVSRDTAPGIVGFKIQFVYPDGTLSTNYVSTNRPKAVSVGIAVIDDKTLEVLRQNPAKIAALKAGFSSSASGSNSLRADWEKHLQQNLDWDDYPRSLATGLKIFERYVSLP